MSSAITATWPMGVYLGHSRDGSPEALPTFARLFSALTHAAATGATSREAGVEGGDSIPPGAEKALLWLERNPPTSMLIPPYISGRRSASTAFRKEGVFRLEGGRKKYKVTERLIGEGTAIGGSLAWIWEESFPDEIAGALERICSDVGCLGEASSMVVLELGEGMTPTHQLSRSRDFFTTGGSETEVPSEGRLENLVAQHREARPKKAPTISADKHNFNAMPSSALPTGHGLARRRLVRITDEAHPDVPWDNVVAIPIEEGRPVKAANRVSFSVAVHRALIALIGTGAPASITGKYDEGVPLPANRVAVQYLPAGLPTRDLEDCPHILLLLPTGMSTADLDALSSGVQQLRVLKTRMGKYRLSRDIQFLDGVEFWQDPRSDEARRWEPIPAAVPERWMEGRTQTEVYRDTIAWSIANVLRDLPSWELSRRVEERRSVLEDSGLHVHWAKPLVTRRPERFVHRTNRQTPIMPYVGELSLGDVLPSTAIAAIGQSRHLGGGLLVPRTRGEEYDDADHS